MGRPRKTGLDYFPLDVDFFDDEKISAISGEFGIKGEITVIRLLCAIYRNGYYIKWGDLLKFRLAKSCPGLSAELIESIVNRLVRWGFFDKGLFDSVKVLTSKGIQRRYFEAAKRRLKADESPPPYMLTNVSVDRNPVNVDRNPGKCMQKVHKGNNNIILSPNGSNINYSDVDDDVGENARGKEKNEAPPGDIAPAQAVDPGVGGNNGRFLAAFFSEANTASLEVLCMQMHTTTDRLRSLAGEVLAEWKLTGQHYDEYTPWARHMVNHLRKKHLENGKQARTTRGPATAAGESGSVRAELEAAAAKPLRSTV